MRFSFIAFFLFFAGSKRQLCIRRRYYFQLQTSCYGQWLEWTPCNAECGGGVQKRFKFVNSPSNPLTQEKHCNTHSCPSWSAWMRSREGCTSSCSVLYTRKCVYRGVEISNEECPPLETSFDDENDNGTHRWQPCSDSECMPTTSPSTTTPTSPTTLAFSSPLSTLSSSDDMIQRLSTFNPRHSKDQSTFTLKTSSDFERSIEATTRKDKDLLPCNSSGPSISMVPTFGSKPFWVGFCIGVAFLLVVFLVVFLLLKIRKSIWCLTKTYQQNGKIYYEHETSQRTSRASGNLKLLPSSGNKNEMKLEGKASVTSTTSLGRDDGSRFLHNNGSLPLQPNYQENNHHSMEPRDYETFYTPVGESKLQSRKLPQLKKPLLADIPDHGFASRESFMTGSESNSDVYEDPDYENTSIYYNQYPLNTIPPKLPDHKGFDEAAYVRKYELCRTERRQKSVGEGRTQGLKAHRRRRKSLDSKTSEPHYAKPMKCTVNQAHYACVNRKNENGTRKPATDSMYLKRMSVRSISTPTLAAITKLDHEEFQFPSPPKFVVDE